MTDPEERRTFVLGVIDGVLIRLFGALTDPSLVLTWFLARLTDSPLAVATLIPISMGGYALPQLFACRLVQNKPCKMPLYRLASFLAVTTWFVMTGLVVLLGAGRPGLQLASFLTLYTVFTLLLGIAGLPFYDIIGKGVSPQRRGAFFAWRDVGGAVLALGGSVIVRQMVGEQRGPPYPANFAALFAVAGLAITVGFTCLGSIHERVEEVPSEDVLVPINAAGVWGVLRSDANFARFVLLRILLVTYAAALPFYTVFAQQRLGAPSDTAGIYLAAYTGMEVLTMLGWGRLGDRRGHKSVLLLSGLLSLPLPFVPLLGGALPYLWLVPVFAVLGSTQGAFRVAVQSFVLDLAPPDKRAVYVAIDSTIMGAVSMLLIGVGLITEWWGLNAVFVLAGLTGLLVPLLAARIRDPRVAQEARA